MESISRANVLQTTSKRGNSVNARKEREFKNQQAYQQSILIGLLNRFSTIVIEKPGKQSKMTTTIPFILSVSLDRSEIIIKELAETQCNLIKEEEIQEGVASKTVNRRYKKNVSAYIQNLLYDICFEIGIDFVSKLSKQSNKSVQIDRIDKIIINENEVITKENIMTYGKQINSYLLSLLDSKKKVTLRRDDKTVQNILSQSVLPPSQI